MKWRGPSSFQWHPVTGSEAIGTNCNARGSLLMLGNTFSLWGWQSTGTGCGRLWSLHPWRYLKAIWTPALGGPAWAGDLSTMTSRGPLQSRPFCDSVKCRISWFWVEIHVEYRCFAFLCKVLSRFWFALAEVQWKLMDSTQQLLSVSLEKKI